MRTFLYLLIFFLAGMKTYSQQPHFLYIQSEERQPFYVRMQEKIFSSTESGYLIISNLEEDNLNLMLGFPKNIYPEQQFQVNTNKKDRGYLLKHSGEKSWVLVNLQNQATINSKTSPNAKDGALSGEKNTDPFSVMLANVVNDSAILYPQNKPQVVQTVIVQKPVENETPKKDTIGVAINEAEALVKKEATVEATTPIVPDKKDDRSDVNVKIKEVPAAAVYDKKAETNAGKETVNSETDNPFISRIQQQHTPAGYKAVYLEQYNFSTDTIDINIPSESLLVTKSGDSVNKTIDSILTNEAEISGKITEVKTSDSSRSVVLEIGGVTDTFKVKKKIVMINSDCKNFATANDVDKLRVRLIAEKNMDEKLVAARKYFKTKCFSVQQVRALTELFPSAETKYRFLDLSYAFTSDSGNYYLLEEVLTEDYYINRFKAMIRK